MSLVNDLLIEVDRQREGTLDDRLSSLSRKAPRRNRKKGNVGAAALATLGLATLFFVFAALLWSSEYESLADVESVAIERPAVAANRFDPISTAIAATPPAVVTSERNETPAQRIQDEPTTTSSTRSRRAAKVESPDDESVDIRSVSISRDLRTTRIRIGAEKSSAYRIESASNHLKFDLILESSALTSPIAELDLPDTPIRSIRAHEDGRDLRLALLLDRKVRIQSQWVSRDGGAVLIVDLYEQEIAGSGDMRNVERLSLSLGSLSDDVASGESSSLEQISTLIDSQIDDPFRFAPESTLEPDGRLQISRSEQDQRRRDLDVLKKRARNELEAARLARADGRIKDAGALYRSAIRTIPNHRDAIMEWAALLAETDRTEDAVKLIQNARQVSPADPALTMLHATLIAEGGKLERAVEILDRAGHSLTESPDVHALAAAFLQQDGEHQLAIERYETVLRRYPGESRWWMGLGISLEATEQKAEARDVYRIAMQLGELPGRTRQWVSNRVTALGEEG